MKLLEALEIVQRVRMETVTVGRKYVIFFGFNTELYPQVSVTSPHWCSRNKALC